MKNVQKPREPVEKVTLETRPPRSIALSMGGCGILTRALVGRHARKYRESESIALVFAHTVVQAMGCSLLDDQWSTPQILVEVADTVIDDPEHVNLLCTTWKYLPEEVEICSVGSNSVLVFEGDTVQKALISHAINELLRIQGQQPNPMHRMQITHALGSKQNEKSCRIDDVRVVLIPLLPTTTIAVIEEPLLADAILERSVPRNQLSSFIESWNPRRRRTSVLISL